MSKSRGHHRHEEHEEHEEHVNHEAWVIPYADMLTLLMALFLVLFAVGRTDLDKFKKLAEGFRKEFGNSSSGAVVDFGGRGQVSAGDGGAGVMSGDGTAIVVTTTTTTTPAQGAAEQTAVDAQNAATAAAVEESDSLEDVEHAVQAAAEALGMGDSLNLTLDARGLVVSIVTDQVLFASGSADLQPAGLSILDVVGQALQKVPNDVLVVGHTDDRPISNDRFHDNWDLSSARANSVVRYFTAQDGIDPARLTPAGKADTEPIADNGTAEGAARNRRVEVIVQASVSLDPVLADDGHVDTSITAPPTVPSATGSAGVQVDPQVVPDVVPDVAPQIGGA